MQFTFKGISNKEMGVIVSVRPPIKSPQSRMQFYNIDGTYGSTSTFLGFEPVSYQMEVIVEAEDYLDSVKGWLTGEGKFTRDDRPGLYQTVHMIDVHEFEQVPNTSIFTGIILYTSYNPIWKVEGEVGVLTEITGHETSWGRAWEIENKGTLPTTPTLQIVNTTKGQIKVGNGVLHINKYIEEATVNVLTGKVIVEGEEDSRAITWEGDIVLGPGKTRIYADRDVSNITILEPSTFV